MSLLKRLLGRPSPQPPLRPDPDIYRLGHARWELPSLLRHPADLHHPHKRLLYELAPPNGDETVEVIRWRAIRALGRRVPPAPVTEVVPGHFDYADHGPGVWHLNFAHHDLFCAAGAAAFAQDEHQVAEHPALYHLRAAMQAAGLAPRTVEDGRPTPVLIRGVRRRLSIDPAGIYGRAFAAATPEAVQAAASVIPAPAASDLIAIEAPFGGSGRYTAAQLQGIFETAASGFAAAAAESPPGPVTVHTGHWGGGAYGGDRALMALIQMAAARAVGVRLVFHHGGDPGPVERALAILARETRRGPAAARLLDRVAGLGFVWGTPDGN